MADKKIGNSIFRFEQEAGIDSKLWNWSGKKYFGEGEDGNGDFGSGSLPSISLECSKLTYLTINTDVLLKFKVSGKSEKDWGGGYDIEIVNSNKSITLSSKKFSVEKGWTFLTNIKSTTTGKVSLQVKVDGILKNTFEFVFQDSKDVFSETEINKVKDELNYLKKYVEEEDPLPEYAGNYCMAAAERGISELLNNIKDFYSVERRTHKRKNKIGFSNLTADDRANVFTKKNFVKSKISLSTKEYFSITLNKKFDYDNVKKKYKDKETLVKLKNEKKVYDLFLKDIKQTQGFHIYYCSIAGANHTMLLIVDNSNPCNAKFEFWDQHAISSSKGSLENIANGDNGDDGINAQVQWLVRWLRGVKKTNGSPKADTFYPELTGNFYKIKKL